MSKTLKYTKFTKYHYCHFSDEWEEDGVDFEYKVEDRKLLPIIVNLVFEDYFESNEVYCDNEAVVKAIKENLTKMIDESDLIGEFADQYEETLTEMFRDEAMEWYKN